MEKRKTGKRETAIAILAFLAGLVGFTAWALVFKAEHAAVAALVQLAIGALLPGFAFAALAFGMDWHAKQGPGSHDRPPSW